MSKPNVPLSFSIIVSDKHERRIDPPGFGPLMAVMRHDGVLEGLYRRFRSDNPKEPTQMYLIDGAPSYLDTRQKDFHWTHSSVSAQFLQYDAHGLYMSDSKFFDAMNAGKLSFAILPSSDEGLYILTDTRIRQDRRFRQKRHPSVVSVRHVRSKVESFQRPTPREIISLQVGLRVEGAGYFNLKEVLSEYLGGMTQDTYLTKSGLSSILFRDFEEFQGFFRNIDGPHALTLDAAQLTCRFHQDHQPMLSTTQRWGASQTIFEDGPEVEGERRLSLADETGKLVLHMRLNTLTGEASTHYFTGVGDNARDRMSVVDIEFTLRDPRQGALLDDHPASHVKPSVMSTTY